MSVVYFVECSGRIKVGVSTDVDARVKALSTGSAHPLSLLGTVPGDRFLESAIHKKLDDYRVQGEWFSDCDSVRSLIGILLREGPAGMGYRAPPPRKKSPVRKKSEQRMDAHGPFGGAFSDSAEMRAYQRIVDASDRYVSDRTVAAVKRERELNLTPGELVNKLIGGYYSRPRWVVAGKMILLIMDLSRDLGRAAMDAILDDDQLPEGVVVKRTLEFADSLKRSLRGLFDSDDISAMELGDFRVASLPSSPDWEDAELISTRFNFVFGRRLAA